MSKTKKPRLTINMIPPRGWGKNIRTIRGIDVYDKVRRICYQRAGYRCEICGNVGQKHPVEAHEEWSFDLHSRKQALVNLLALCPRCHKVKHYMRSVKNGEEKLVRRHIMKVNKWKPRKLKKYLDEYNTQFHYLYTINWEVDISFVDTYLAQDAADIEVMQDLVEGLVDGAETP